jgi:hypothetical protein
VPHLNGLNRSVLVRSTAGEIASAAEMARINVTFPGEPSLPCKLRKTHEYGSITPPTVNKDVILSDIEQSEGEIEGNAIAFASLRKLSSKDVAR